MSALREPAEKDMRALLALSLPPFQNPRSTNVEVSS